MAPHPAGKGDFANRAPVGAKRDSRAPDSIGLALVSYAALIVVASLSGAFGTHELEAGPRLSFWTALILWNAMKWLLRPARQCFKIRGETLPADECGRGKLEDR